MQTFTVTTQHGVVVATRVRQARSFVARLVGLLNRSTLDWNEGLLLTPGGAVHTLGMRFSIDVLFLDANLHVRGIANRVPPRRLRWAPRGTASVLELACGRGDSIGLREGDVMAVQPNRR